MMKMKLNKTYFCLLILTAVCISVSGFSFAEHSTWDCPECGRTGNTGNFCGECAHPAPWIEQPSKSIAEGTCGANVTWSLSEDGVLTISGTGAMKNYTDDVEKPWQNWMKSIKSVDIKDVVTHIGALAFNYFGSLTDVTISNTVRSIGKGAFFETGLTNVVIPDSVTSIGFDALLSCRNLQKIEVSSGNKKYMSIDGILYDKDQKTLIACPGGRKTDVTVPNTVTRIEAYAFENCWNIKNITLSENIKHIYLGAFWNCGGLISITIPAGITFIESDAFKYCSSLKNVYFSGTFEIWKKIHIDANNDCLLNANIHYK